MSRVVLKFGGSILRRSADYVKLVEEVKKYLERGDEVIVVVSAIKGVTDTLDLLSRPCDRWYEHVLHLRELHERVLHELGLPSSLEKEVRSKLNSLLEDLYKIVEAINVVKETSPRVRDYVLSFGERLSALIAWAAFMKYGVEAVYLTGREAGIVTDDRFGEATPLYDISRKLVNETIPRYTKAGIVPIVTGFIAGTVDGKITTLGRGGSDLTATLLGALLDADRVILYTDVPGIMTGDPKYVKNPKVVPKLSYEEAIVSARLGAKRLHPRTFEPVKKTNVKTIITTIGAEEKTEITREKTSPPLKLVAHLERNELVRVQVPERKLCDLLMELSILLSKMQIEDIPIFTYSELDKCLMMIVREDLLSKMIQVLQELKSKQLIVDMTYVHYVSIISIIGHGVTDISLLSPILDKLRDVHVYTTLMFDNAYSIVTSSDRSVEVLTKIHDELIRQWQ